MPFSCPFHDYLLKLCAPHIAHYSAHPFILSIYHILDFWSKIRFRIHVIIIQGQMHLLKKIHNFIIPVITFITIIHYNNCLERTAVLWTSLLIPPGLHSTNNLGHCLLPLLHQLHHQPFLLRSLQCNLQVRESKTHRMLT